MLEWTGERFLPWVKDATLAYEHLHRYAYASWLVEGKRVLDLASGEGYGANLLGRTALEVVGVDIDESSIAHATAKYGSDKVRFVCGSISRIPVEEDHSFDAVVCFEAIEHVTEHEQLLAEVKRVLKPSGLFIVSTPNKAVYHEESTEENPFHVKELSIEEFQRLLFSHFKHVEYFGQRIHADSSIWPMHSETNGTVRQFVIERQGSEFDFVSDDKRTPLYVIAIASDSAESVQRIGSVLIDHSNELLKDKDRIIRELLETKESQETALKWRDQQLKERDEQVESLEEAVSWREVQIKDRDTQILDRDAQIQEREQALKWTRGVVEEKQSTIASQEEALAWRAHQVDDLEKEKAVLLSQLHTSQNQLRITTEQLEAIHASRSWKLILRLRYYRDQLRALLGR